MKCNPWRWLWGLIPILMLGWIAILGEREQIEADLAARTKTVLERNGFGWASVHFEGRDATLSGRALDEDEPPKAAAAVLDTMGVRIVDNRASLADKVVTYEWGALRRDDRIRVNGLVPSDKTRRDVIGIVKANFPSLEVDDRMKLGRGSPPIDTWMGGVSFGLKQLALLREGRVELENTSISVSGTAQDAASYRAVKAALSGQLPQGIRLKSDAVRPPPASPYTWTVRRQGNEWLLTGHVPTDAAHDELIRTARRVAPKAKIVDRMEPASGAPDRFVEAANAVLVQLGLLDEGEGRVRDQSLTLRGVAETSARAEQTRGAMKQGVLMAFRADGEIRHREPAVKVISPYETAATLEPGRFVLSGYVPDEAARAVLVAMARERFAGVPVDDRLQIGSGQPDGWRRCLEAGFNALRKLGSGRMALTDRRLQVIGTTEAEALAQALPASVRSEAGATCDTSVRVTLDLAALQTQQAEEERRRAEAAARQQQAEEERRRAEAAARQQQAEEERRRAEAAARQQQAEEERRRVEAAARQQQAEEERRRAEAAARQQQAEEERRRAEAAARQQQAEEERRRAEAAARQQQAEEERRRAEAAARQQQAEEERRRAEAAARQQQAEEERRRAEAAARQQQAEEERRRAEAAARQKAEAAARQKAEAERIAKLPAAEKQRVIDVCQEALTRVVREGVINFNRASYDLDPASYPTLNKVADAANRCPALSVEIEGHTDSEGTPARNKRLSDRRANTVREYLSRAGVEPSRLEAIGFGETRPVAPNDTPDGRARNRRIEFVVKFKQ